MSRHPVSVGSRTDATEYRNELLERLGLTADASDQDIETTYNALVDFLELAPHGVKPWAAALTTDVDEAFALLSGPEQDLVRATEVAAMAQDGPGDTPPLPVVTPTKASVATPATAAKAKPRRTQMMAALGAVVVVGVVFGVYQMGQASEVPGISGKPTNQTTAAAGGATAVPVDKAKVGALMKKISANPKDIASLQGLGDIYFGAADYKNASAWEQKILAVDPKNQVALLALGAAQFNLGNAPEAKKQWLLAASLYPNSAEVHYDLGFLYMSQTPPDSAKMQAEWKKVVAIDPTSELAKTVATHLKGSTPSSNATATPSAK